MRTLIAGYAHHRQLFEPVGPHNAMQAYTHLQKLVDSVSMESTVRVGEHRRSRIVSFAGGRMSIVESVQVRRREDSLGFCIINDYIVLRELGRGAHGKVSLVQDSFGRNFALKEVPRSDLRQVMTGEQFGTEVAIMKKLRHRNIITLHEVIDDPNNTELYMVMQYAESGPILTLNPESGRCIPIAINSLPSVMKQLLEAVCYLHDSMVAHRDIKPDNILHDSQGQVFLTDFGVSSIMSAHKSDRRMGTPAFTPPELLRGGSDDIDGVAVDAWAIGVTLHLMLFGALPFRGETVSQLLEQIAQGLELPPKYNEWHGMLKGLLESDPKRRCRPKTLLAHEIIRGAQLGPVKVNDDDVRGAVIAPNGTVERTPSNRARAVVNAYVEKLRRRMREAEAAATTPTSPRAHIGVRGLLRFRRGSAHEISKFR